MLLVPYDLYCFFPVPCALCPVLLVFCSCNTCVLCPLLHLPHAACVLPMMHLLLQVVICLCASSSLPLTSPTACLCVPSASPWPLLSPPIYPAGRTCLQPLNCGHHCLLAPSPLTTTERGRRFMGAQLCLFYRPTSLHAQCSNCPKAGA